MLRKAVCAMLMLAIVACGINMFIGNYAANGDVIVHTENIVDNSEQEQRENKDNDSELTNGSGEPTNDSNEPKDGSGEPKVSFAQRNAFSRANAYLNMTNFSYAGLIALLEAEGFTRTDAVNAVNLCSANWNKQAAEKARSYMKHGNVSRSKMAKKLKRDGFTNEQIEYGIAYVFNV